MKTIHQNAPVQPNPTGLSAGRLLERMGSSIKRLLVVGLLAFSFSALAGDPTATDMGRFIKFMGKQAVTSPVAEDARLNRGTILSISGCGAGAVGVAKRVLHARSFPAILSVMFCRRGQVEARSGQANTGKI